MVSRNLDFFFLCCLITDASCFLLETTPPSSDGHVLTYSHYMQIMDLVFEERRARQQLEQTVKEMQVQCTTAQQHSSTLGHYVDGNFTDLFHSYVDQLEAQQKNIETLQNIHNSSVKKNEVQTENLQNQILSLEQNLEKVKSENHDLKTEVSSLKQVKDLSVARTLQNTVVEMNQIKSSLLARGQDLVSLHKMTLSLRNDTHSLDMLLNESIKDSDKRLKNLSTTIQQTQADLQHTSNKVSSLMYDKNNKVGFTACDGRKISNNILDFPTTKTSYGPNISATYRNGIFTPSIPGFYLISVNVLGRESDGVYISRDGHKLSRTWFNFQAPDGYHTGATSAFVRLNTTDKVSVRLWIGAALIDTSSCLSIIKF